MNKLLIQLVALVMLSTLYFGVLNADVTLAQDTEAEAQTITVLDFDKAVILVSVTVNIILVAVMGVFVFKFSPGQVDDKLAEAITRAGQNTEYIEAWRDVFNGLNDTVKDMIKTGLRVGEIGADLTVGIDADDAIVDMGKKIAGIDEQTPAETAENLAQGANSDD